MNFTPMILAAMAIEFEFDVFHGRLTPQAAELYVRVSNLPGGGEWKIRGQVRGPDCRHAQTIPLQVPLIDLGAGPTLLARATLADPCFWSPDLPMLYRAHVEVQHLGKTVFAAERIAGMRFLGTRSRSFYWQGQRWVLRGVCYESVEQLPLSRWRDEVAAMVIRQPANELCLEASHEGVMILAEVGGSSEAMANELRRLARWPAVAMVAIDSGDYEINHLRQVAPNLLLAQRLSNSSETTYGWAQAVVMDEEAIDGTKFAIPQLVYRRLNDRGSLVRARQACDELQQDVASYGDFAGYFVG